MTTNYIIGLEIFMMLNVSGEDIMITEGSPSRNYNSSNRIMIAGKRVLH